MAKFTKYLMSEMTEQEVDAAYGSLQKGLNNLRALIGQIVQFEGNDEGVMTMMREICEDFKG